MRIVIAKDYQALSKKAAHIIAGQLIMKPDSVLGLATGSTPLGTYQTLVTMVEDGLASFSQAQTFNLDEYYGLGPQDPQSYYYFMQQNLFSRVDMRSNCIHIPDGLAGDVQMECLRYEEQIRRHGGIDLQLLGIGRNGHIGFNEPDLKFEAITHLVALDQDTIEANARFFDEPSQVPRQAISMGIKTIMHARKILLLASGKEKASTVYQMVYGDIRPELPASVLQIHPDVTIIVDEAAAEGLAQMRGTDTSYIRIE